MVWSALQAKTLVGVSAGEGPAFSRDYFDFLVEDVAPFVTILKEMLQEEPCPWKRPCLESHP